MSTAHATAADTAGDALRTKASLVESAFAKSHATAADIAQSVDQARPLSEQALADTASGPLLMQQTLSVLDAIPDVPFDELCNNGKKVGVVTYRYMHATPAMASCGCARTGGGGEVGGNRNILRWGWGGGGAQGNPLGDGGQEQSPGGGGGRRRRGGLSWVEWRSRSARAILDVPFDELCNDGHKVGGGCCGSVGGERGMVRGVKGGRRVREGGGRGGGTTTTPDVPLEKLCNNRRKAHMDG